MLSNYQIQKYDNKVAENIEISIKVISLTHSVWSVDLHYALHLSLNYKYLMIEWPAFPYMNNSLLTKLYIYAWSMLLNILCMPTINW